MIDSVDGTLRFLPNKVPCLSRVKSLRIANYHKVPRNDPTQMTAPIPDICDPFAFKQVKEPLDLFVVHAAYACVLHPRCENEVSLPGCGSLGWWNGGNLEEASQLPKQY